MKPKYIFTAVLFTIYSMTVLGQNLSSKDEKLLIDAKDAIAQFKKSDPIINRIFETAHGYVVFPNVGKGGLGVGGAAGNGAVYEKGVLVGMAKLSQINIGFQAGGQAYREVIFFENADVLNRFKENKVELAASASAVMIADGAAAAAKYQNGVMIFTQTKGGLMYEASVGGQKFSFRKL
jgi:lipid-binding SYLF domain-containing protein